MLLSTSVSDNWPVSTKSSVRSELTGTPTETAPLISEPVISTVSGTSSWATCCPCAQAAAPPAAMAATEALQKSLAKRIDARRWRRDVPECIFPSPEDMSDLIPRTRVRKTLRQTSRWSL